MRRYLLLTLFLSGALWNFNAAAAEPSFEDGSEITESSPLYVYMNYDVQLRYVFQSFEDQTLVRGDLKNIHFAQMEDVEVWVTAIDSDGYRTPRTVDFIIPRSLSMDESTDFNVVLPLLKSGTKLQITYRYLGSDGPDAVTRDYQTFYTEVP